MNRILNLYTNAKHGHSAAALFAVVLALAGFANAASVSSTHSHKGKKGGLTITAPTEVGGVTLQPGDYEVKEVDSPGGPVVEFSLFEKLEWPIFWSATKTVVARVKCTEQALSSRPKHTRLMLASNTTHATGLEIRGKAVDYYFAPSHQMTDEAGD